MDHLVTNILEDEQNVCQTYFRTQEIIVIVCQLGIGEMIPTAMRIERRDMPTTGKRLRAGITIEQSG